MGKYLLLKHKTTDSLLQTDIWNTYLEIRDIRLFSKFENNSHQDRICSFFVSRSSNILQKTKPIFCLRVFNHHVILNNRTRTFEQNSIVQDSTQFLLFNVYISAFTFNLNVPIILQKFRTNTQNLQYYRPIYNLFNVFDISFSYFYATQKSTLSINYFLDGF